MRTLKNKVNSNIINMKCLISNIQGIETIAKDILKNFINPFYPSPNTAYNNS